MDKYVLMVWFLQPIYFLVDEPSWGGWIETIMWKGEGFNIPGC